MVGIVVHTNDLVERVETIEKPVNLLYSVDGSIFLSLKDVPKSGGSNPFFDTRSTTLTAHSARATFEDQG